MAGRRFKGARAAMTLQPPLLDVLGARWALGSAVTAVAWSGGLAGFALADGTVALAPAPWQGAPALRRREREGGGGVELVPARGPPPPPLARASVSRGPCLALAGVGDGFLCGASDGRLRKLAPDGKAAKAASFGAPVEAVAATGGGTGWACVAGGRVHGDPPPPGAGDLAGATGLAWHPAAGLAVAHAGGVALCRGPAAEPLPGGAPAAAAALAFGADGRWLAGGLALWRLSPPAPAAPVALPGLSGPPPAAAAFSAGADLLALAGPEGVRLWRLADGEASPIVGGWQARGQASTALAFHPRRALLAAAYANGAVLLGPPDGNDAVLLRGASGADGVVAALAFSADGAWLAIGGAGGECALVALPELLFRPGGTRPAAGTAGGEAP